MIDKKLKLKPLLWGSKALFNESCPVCEQKHFLELVKRLYYPNVQEHTMDIVYMAVQQSEAEFIRCNLCKSIMELPEELVKK